jgi:surfeit locus 1 family protein
MSRVSRVLLVITVVLLAAVAVSLGRWQLRRLAARRASNLIFLAAGARPPMHLPADLGSVPQIDSGRRVVARGTFDPDDQIILRGRAQDGIPGVQVVTPFVMDSGRAILWVLRGFVRSPDAVTIPDSIPAPTGGELEISGIAYAIPVTTDSGQPLLHNGRTTWNRLDRSVLAHRRAGSLPVYLLLGGDSTGPERLTRVPPTPVTNGPHLSYAIQWFGIALAIVAFGVIMLWRSGRAPTQHPEVP